MNNLFLKIIIALNVASLLFPCGFCIARYIQLREVRFLLFAIFFIMQIICSFCAFDFICKVEDHANDKNVHVSNESKDKNK